MNTIKHKLLTATLCFSAVLLSATYTSADDTEIFFSNTTTSGAIQPNVLFVMDTSSSMTNKDGGTETRLDRMKAALRTMIENANNVNIGIMRFIRTGGAVLYPVRNINEFASSSVIGDVTAQIAENTDDAEEDITSSHAVTLDNSALSITTRTIGGIQSGEWQVSQNSDDMEESQNGTMKTTSTDLELMKDGSTAQTVGVRFAGIAIPTGAKILSASLEFTIDENHLAAHSANLEIDIYGEADDSGTFLSTSKNITKREPLTGQSVAWQMNTASPAVNDTISTPDLTAVVQEMVSHAGWNGTSDALTFILIKSGNDSGVRTVEAHDGDPEKAPKLRVTYQPAGGESTSSSLVGLRFQDVAIPQGAEITSATIDFTAATPSSGTASYLVVGEDVDDSVTFTNAYNNISNRLSNRTTSDADWTNADDWTATDQVNATPDLTSIVQEITNRPGWCGGNSMTFIIAASGSNVGSRLAKAFDDNASNSPKLKITYDPDTIPDGPEGGCLARTYTAMVKGSANDAEEYLPTPGTVSLDSSDLEMVTDNGTAQLIGMRFEDLYIPNGSTVTNAYLEFTADGATSEATTLSIKAAAVDSAAIFTNGAGYLSGLGTTSDDSAVPWAVPSWTHGVRYASPDISSVVQELVSRPGWNPGNDMAFLISGSGNRRAESYDGNPALAPKLVIRAKSYGQPASTAKTVRDELLDIVDDMYASSGTPIVDALYEAALYYRGDAVDKGKTRGTNSDSAIIYDRVSHDGSHTGGTHDYPEGCSADNLNDLDCKTEQITGSPIYTSPIEHECQTSNIVLLSDGQASLNASAAKVKTMANIDACVDTGNDECGVELARYLYQKDQLSSLAGDQTIKTYTIGFNFTSEFLEDIAAVSEVGMESNFYTANSSADLVAKFDDIFKGLMKVDTTFVSPGVTVNSFNRLNHRDELYFSLFRPESEPNWTGNLKRYRLDVTGDIYDYDPTGGDGKVATDPATGFFSENARSWWSSSDDGNVVAAGGAAANLPDAANRHVYTYYSGSSSDVLSNGVNHLSVANIANITMARLGLDAATTSVTYQQNLINWARGLDVLDSDNDGSTTDSRKALADPLHSVPHLVTYGGTDDAPDITIFYGDNQGFVHAIDGDTGVEDFAFIPEELLPNLDIFFANAESADHPYGMDGAVTSWVKDVDGDNQIEEGDHVYLYVGMRRGGRSYYALDVTDRAAPEFLWKITGGSGTFAELGQTWSRPTRTKVKINNAVTDVLIFTGGYDEAQDAYTVRTADTMGRAIYIVNATDGELIWAGGGPSSSGSFNETYADMLYSMPSSVRIIDVNGDHLVDQIYVGDMGGQLWRFDVNNGNNLSTLIDGGVIADIAGSTAESNRRFYHAPDVSVQNLHAQKTLLIAMGSGYQAHPLNETIEDRFYVFKDANVFSKPVDADENAVYTKLTESDLFDTTDNLIGEGTDEQQATASTAMNAADGWYIRLTRDGEKVLASSMTVGGEIFFTTYEPTPNTNGCTVSAGTPRMFRVHAKDGTPVMNYDDIGTVDALTADDREKGLTTQALPPEPQRLRVDGQDILCIGTECEKIEGVDTIVRTYWVEDQQ